MAKLIGITGKAGSGGRGNHDHGVEQVGRELRKLMSWIDDKEVD